MIFRDVSNNNNNSNYTLLAFGGLSGATSFYIYIPFFLLNFFFLLFSAFLRSRTRRTRISIDFPLFSGCSKYLPLVSKGGWLPPFHAPSSATHEIIHNFTNIFFFIRGKFNNI